MDCSIELLWRRTCLKLFVNPVLQTFQHSAVLKLCSAAVITAYLMRLERLTVDEASASLQQVSSKVYPNYGFMQQLQLFEEMGYVVDRKNLSFKKFHLENLGKHV